MELIVNNNSVFIKDGQQTIYKRENCTVGEVRDILDHIGAYQKRSFLGLGKPKWVLSERFVMSLKTELL